MYCPLHGFRCVRFFGLELCPEGDVYEWDGEIAKIVKPDWKLTLKGVQT